MNRAPDPDRDDLLADVLAEAEPADFRTALLGETLRLARRRRRVRRATRATAVAAALLAVGIFAWRAVPPASSSSEITVAARAVTIVLTASHPAVSTYPFSPDAIVRTQPLAPAQWVTSFVGVATIRTPDTDRHLRIIGDQELLALAAPRPAALVRIGPQAQELIFADGEGHLDSP